MAAGRPLRFLGVMLCGWCGARGVAIYRDGMVAAGPLEAPIRRIIAVLAPAADAAILPIGAADRRSVHAIPPRPSSDRTLRRTTASAATGTGRADHPSATAFVRHTDPSIPARRIAVAPQTWPGAALPPVADGRSRWAASAWAIARGGVRAVATGSQLGASQAGVRVTYLLDRSHRIALAGRASAPLAGRGREASLGIDWQPTRLPIHVLAEQRLSLDGGRGGPTLAIVGGFGPVDVAPGFRLEGYGQAGVIARDGGEGFADGAIRASHPLVQAGRLRVDIGAGIWGGAQRGASRLDVGPSLGVTAPIGGHAVRVTADWRQRIAGESRPGSGPALSLGTDF